MCGVAGWLDHRAAAGLGADTDEVLQQMRDSMIHRGPDDFGSWHGHSGRVALANRRLSIVDLSERARQPMISENAEIVLSYNGEIYNHVELREQLERLGYRFRSNCDTETVLYSFEEWGIDCLRRFKGQFAIAVWDGRTRELYLARDRVGLQPLYFYSLNSLVVFGSELRAILRHPAVDPQIDLSGLYQYYVMHAPAPPLTLLRHVYSVPAGSYVLCRTGEVPQLWRYWSVLDEVGKEDLTAASDSELAARLRETLLQAVRRRLMSDRPVGLFLSGGLDSTSILACMAALGCASIQSFSIGYANEKTGETADEFDYARIGAKEFKSAHTLLRSRPERLQEFASSCDQPPENLSEFWLWEMAEVASDKGVPVILHGEGADELFFGYDFHWRVLAERQRIDQHPEQALVSPIDSGIPSAQWSATTKMSDRDALADLLFWGGGVHPSLEYLRHQYFGPDLISVRHQTTAGLNTSRYQPMGKGTDVLSFIQACYATARSGGRRTDYRHKMQYLEFIHKLPEVLLRRGERSTIKHSVEIRLPFLDEDVISLAVNLPIEALKNSETVKYPLRMAMNGLVPERVRNRPKEFFGISFLEASRKWPYRSEWFRHYLLDSEFADLGYIPQSYLRQRYERLRQDQTGFETLLWKQTFAAVWFENFVSEK